MRHYCVLTAALAPRGGICPVHHTTECLRPGWISDIRERPATTRERLGRLLGLARRP